MGFSTPKGLGVDEATPYSRYGVAEATPYSWYGGGQSHPQKPKTQFPFFLVTPVHSVFFFLKKKN